MTYKHLRLLIGEDNNVTDTWDIYGKTSIVFGRDEGGFQVDVNLKNTDYAGTIDGEHAVMNYSGGWNCSCRRSAAGYELSGYCGTMV